MITWPDLGPVRFQRRRQFLSGVPNGTGFELPPPPELNRWFFPTTRRVAPTSLQFEATAVRSPGAVEPSNP